MINPDFSFAYCKMGVSLVRTNKIAEAISSLFRAIELDNEYEEAYDFLKWVMR